MKLFTLVMLAVGGMAANVVVQGDPQLTTWLTEYSGQYARVYTNDANRFANISQSTWSSTNGSQMQALPTYAGVSEVTHSPTFVYIRTTGLAPYVMGPWYNAAGRVTIFPNVPLNLAAIFRIPRQPTLPAGNRVVTLAGINGFFVDGVAMFDMRDLFSVTDPSGTETSAGLRIWSRDATFVEGVTFDPAFAHAQGAGQYHYHSNPRGVRHLLGDNVVFDPATKNFTENLANTNLKHSPIVGWVRDGYPMYGPYGYANATNSASGVRRMISGYVLRNGLNGTQNLTNAGRTNIPLWAVRFHTNTLQVLDPSQYGPAVSAARPLGRYIEDNDYLGDLINPGTGSNFVQGTHFDLDEYNGRFCVTPEFPGGTYAYFVAIASNGAAAFPYYLGRVYYGRPQGGVVTSIAESVVTNFSGGPRMPLNAAAPAIHPTDGNLTLTWSAIDGGTYVIEAATNLNSWSAIATNLPPAAQTNTPVPLVTRAFADADAANPTVTNRFYRVRLTATNSYDSTGFAP